MEGLEVFYHKNPNQRVMRRRGQRNRKGCDHDGSLQYRSVGFAMIRLDEAREVAEETPLFVPLFRVEGYWHYLQLSRNIFIAQPNPCHRVTLARKRSGHVLFDCC